MFCVPNSTCTNSLPPSFAVVPSCRLAYVMCCSMTRTSGSCLSAALTAALPQGTRQVTSNALLWPGDKQVMYVLLYIMVSTKSLWLVCHHVVCCWAHTIACSVALLNANFAPIADEPLLVSWSVRQFRATAWFVALTILKWALNSSKSHVVLSATASSPWLVVIVLQVMHAVGLVANPQDAEAHQEQLPLKMPSFPWLLQSDAHGLHHAEMLTASASEEPQHEQ